MNKFLPPSNPEGKLMLQVVLFNRKTASPIQLFTFRFIKIEHNFTNLFFSQTSHISSSQQPYVASGYCIGEHRYTKWNPVLQKFLLKCIVPKCYTTDTLTLQVTKLKPGDICITQRCTHRAHSHNIMLTHFFPHIHCHK